jgi:hypothetical protein
MSPRSPPASRCRLAERFADFPGKVIDTTPTSRVAALAAAQAALSITSAPPQATQPTW